MCHTSHSTNLPQGWRRETATFQAGRAQHVTTSASAYNCGHSLAFLPTLVQASYGVLGGAGLYKKLLLRFWTHALLCCSTDLPCCKCSLGAAVLNLNRSCSGWLLAVPSPAVAVAFELSSSQGLVMTACNYKPYWKCNERTACFLRQVRSGSKHS